MPEVSPEVVMPVLTYEDGAAAIDWLVRVFGFRERHVNGERGKVIGHAELKLDEGVIMLHSNVAGYTPRKAKAAAVYCYVRDIEAHFAHAKAEGAEIDIPLTDAAFDKFYAAFDHEGHYWWFAQRRASGRTLLGEQYGSPLPGG